MKRRELIKGTASVAAASTVTTVLGSCGKEISGKAVASCSNALQAEPSPDLIAIAKYYGNGAIEYISTKQGGGTNYKTKVYANPVTVAEAVAENADTTKPLAVIRGFYLDPFDSGHNPVVTITKTSAGASLAIKIEHDVQSVADKDGAHGITAIDIWVPLSSKPTKTYKFTAAAKSPASITMELTSEELKEAASIYLVTHCNNHGGRAQILNIPRTSTGKTS